MRGVPELRLVPVRLKVLDERLRGTKFVSLAPRSVLNPPAQTGMDFWSLNPYVGCEFGCTYCYARYAHRYVVERAHDAGKLSDAEFGEFRGEHGWEAFEKRVFVKDEGVLAALDRDLHRYFRTAFPPAVPMPGTIVIGTATDPYQPAERRFRITRRVLERLATYEGLSLGIITKSPLIARDVDLLTRIARRSAIEIYISLISVDVPLIRAVEMRSPMPAARLRALKKLTDAGLEAGLIVAPVLPGLSDDVPHLDALFRDAKAAGARFIHAGALRLYSAVRERFLPVLAERFPELMERYRTAYSRATGAPDAYARALSRRVKKLQVKWGFPVNNGMRDRYRAVPQAPQGELALSP